MEASFRIFWKGEEAPGILVYGYWRGAPTNTPACPIDAWGANVESESTILRGTGWTVLMWDLRIQNWPSRARWETTLNQTLQPMLLNGARVAWCGVEGGFADPPSLFSPKEMSGSVYAAVASDFPFLCTARLGEPFVAFDSSQLLALRNLL